MKLTGWAWIIWAGVGLVLETVAILSPAAGDTLTERIVHTFPPLAVILGALWVPLHFVTRAFQKWRDE